MLLQLCIENIAVVEKCELDFSKGLNILTGETGAGKSIVIDSINAIIGGRVSKDLVRTGASYGCISALFGNLPPSFFSVAEELGFEPEEDGTLLIQRRITVEGKSLCRINGRPATLSLLKTIGRYLINIHGQQDSPTLMLPEKQRQHIDMMLEDQTILPEYQRLFHQFSGVQKELTGLQMDETEKERRIDLLQYQIQEIEAANMQPGEIKELLERKEQLLHGEKIMRCMQEAYGILYGNDAAMGACTMLSESSGLLEEAAQYYPPLEALSKAFQEISYTADEYIIELRDELNHFSFDIQELEQIEERLDQLYRLRRKYGADEVEILTFLENARAELEAITSSSQRIQTLETQAEKIHCTLMQLTGVLTQARKRAAEKFSEQVIQELRFLDMPQVKFKVHFDADTLNSYGADKIEFLIATNPGEPPKPLAKIASGGELSRIMLAIKNVLADQDDIGTLIFDEIDTGVSGRAAQKIGLKLREAAQTRQIICVTHSAQVAAQAHHHLLITKNVKENKTFTTIIPLDFEGRKQELARIMGGMVITDLQIKSAEEMLRNANNT